MNQFSVYKYYVFLNTLLSHQKQTKTTTTPPKKEKKKNQLDPPFHVNSEVPISKTSFSVLKSLSTVSKSCHINLTKFVNNF